MFLSFLVILAVGAIAFFHYVQGFFSATLSTIMAIVAAVLAISFHQPLVELLGQWRFANQAHALALIALFAGIYILLRLVFDALVPGNIRLPAMVDKVGGAAMGVIAGIFGVGIVVIAAQAMPFYPGIAGYARYEIVDSRAVSVPRQGRMALDTHIVHELREDGFDERRRQRLIIPVDDMVIGLTEHLSDNGSLAGQRPLQEVHPDYLDELFAQRLGVQVGAQRTAINVDPRQDVTVQAIYRLDSILAGDAEMPQLRQEPPALLAGVEQPARITPREDQVMLVVRTNMSNDAADEGNLFRFSLASTRLVYNRQNYHPIGTLENANFLFVNRLDDPLVANAGAAIDFVFLLPADIVQTRQEAGEAAVAGGAFIEVKRLARVDLSGTRVQPRVERSDRVRVVRKPPAVQRFAAQVGAAPVAGRTGRPEQPAEPADAGPQRYHNARFAFAVDRPGDWSLEEIDAGTVRFHAPDEDSPVRASITISADNLPAIAPTLEQHVRRQERLLEEQADVRLLGSDSASLAGQNAWRFEYIRTEDGQDLRVTALLVSRDREVFTLELAAVPADHSRFRTVAEETFNTFRFE